MSASRQVAVYWEEDPTLARQEVEGGGNNSKHREGQGCSRCSSRRAPCGNPWSGPCSVGTVAALAEGVMDMMVRMPRSQHSNPQAGVGAGEGSQGAVVPAQLLGKGPW